MSARPVAVVTGAAGRIGAAIAAALADDFAVVGLDREEANDPFPIIAADVSDRAEIEAAAARIAAELGLVRVVVNNAGMLTMSPFLELGDDDWRRVFDVNAYGTFLVSQVFARQMSSRGGGRIVNVASIAGKTPLENQAHYCASKAAVIMLTRVMATELAASGISVFSICPGAVDTALFRACLDWSAKREGREPDDLLADWLRPSRIGRFVKPEEIGQLVRYLAAGPTAAITGHAISIDGGVAPW